MQSYIAVTKWRWKCYRIMLVPRPKGRIWQLQTPQVNHNVPALRYRFNICSTHKIKRGTHALRWHIILNGRRSLTRWRLEGNTESRELEIQPLNTVDRVVNFYNLLSCRLLRVPRQCDTERNIQSVTWFTKGEHPRPSNNTLFGLTWHLCLSFAWPPTTCFHCIFIVSWTRPAKLLMLDISTVTQGYCRELRQYTPLEVSRNTPARKPESFVWIERDTHTTPH